MNKIHNILVIAAFFLALNMHGQEFGSNVIGVEKGSSVSLKNTFKPDVSVTLGSSFTSFGQGFTAFGTYIMPEVTMPVSKKFSIRAGLGYSSMFISTPENTGSIFGQNNVQYGTVYVSGLYQVSPKLRIAGSVHKTFDLAPKNDEIIPYTADFSNEGLMIDVEYKVSENFRINAGFSYQKRNPYNYFYNPVGYNMHPSPFQNNGFGYNLEPYF